MSSPDLEVTKRSSGASWSRLPASSITPSFRLRPNA